MPTDNEDKGKTARSEEMRESLLQIAKKLSDGKDAIYELKTLLEENNLGTKADSNLLTVVWVLNQLIYGPDINFGEGLNVREECEQSLKTYVRQLNQSIGDYYTEPHCLYSI